jgi:hypothetical protein
VRNRSSTELRFSQRHFARLLALIFAFLVLAVIYDIISAAVQDSMIAAVLTLLLYLPFAPLCISRR